MAGKMLLINSRIRIIKFPFLPSMVKALLCLNCAAERQHVGTCFLINENFVEIRFWMNTRLVVSKKIFARIV